MLEVNTRPDRRIIRVERIDNILVLHTNHGRIKIEPKTPDILRVVYTLREEFSAVEKPGITMTKDYGGWDYEETKQRLTLNTGKVLVHIDKETASFRYYDQSGKLLLAEREYESKNLEEFDSYKTVQDQNTKVERVVTPDGVKEVIKEAAMVFDQRLYRTRLYLQWQEGEAIYGLGQHEEGQLNLRGTTVYLHQANLKISIPLLVSSLGYGILMDTYSPMIFNDNAYGSYLYTEADQELDYYFLHGQTLDGVIKCYRQLTGKAAMLPKWAFGFLQSQERYESSQELQEVVAEYRRRKIGLDGIVLDWCSWEGNLWGQKTFDPVRFADPADMLERLHTEHVKLMISIWPNMSKDCDNYKEFQEAQLLLPASSIYDAYQQRGRELYWKQAKEGLFRHGVDAWWCDSSEPVTPEWSHKGKPEPSSMYQEYYNVAGKYIPAWLTNSYGLFHARTIYEGQRKATEEKRVFNLTRNGYTGQQRYGAVLWSGDISASWDTLKKQIVAGLNFCASGIPYWTLDIGGFFVKKGVQWFWNGEYERGYEDLGYRELFIRWFQFGCFLPVFRSHGTDIRRELWHFGKEGDMFYEALLKMNRLRYELMPYLYSMAAKVWREDATMLRLLAFDFAEDERALGIVDQYLFGDNLMVCPVTSPMYYGKNSEPIKNEKRSRSVYLPKGRGWYDFWSGNYYEGGQTVEAEAPLDRLPIYVKAGSILPMTQSMQYTDEIPDAPVVLKVFAGRDAEFELYEDEGDSYRYEEGQYTLTKLIWSEEKKELTITDPEGTYPGQISRREYRIEIHSAG